MAFIRPESPETQSIDISKANKTLIDILQSNTSLDKKKKGIADLLMGCFDAQSCIIYHLDENDRSMVTETNVFGKIPYVNNSRSVTEKKAAIARITKKAKEAIDYGIYDAGYETVVSMSCKTSKTNKSPGMIASLIRQKSKPMAMIVLMRDRSFYGDIEGVFNAFQPHIRSILAEQ